MPMEKIVVELRKDVIDIDPCSASKNKVSGEIKAFGKTGCKFNIKETKPALEAAGFDNVKASWILGATKARLDGKDITIFKNGRINIFRADGGEDLLNIVEKVLVESTGPKISSWKIFICGVT